MKRTLLQLGLILQFFLFSWWFGLLTFGCMMTFYKPIKWTLNNIIMPACNWYKRTWYIKSLEKLGA